MNWILCGFKSCGKTYFGKRLKRPFLDTDELIEAEEGFCVRDIVLQHGESYFRELEKKIVYSLPVKGYVIALGGGTILDKKSLKHLQSLGIFIYLKCSKSLLKERVFTPPLPTFFSEKDFERIYSQRIPLYEKIASYTIEVTTEKETLENLWQVINSETSSESQHGENPTEKLSVSSSMDVRRA